MKMNNGKEKHLCNKTLTPNSTLVQVLQGEREEEKAGEESEREKEREREREREKEGQRCI